MALNIKDTVTDDLARQLAAETGESITVAIRVAIEERLARVRARRRTSDGTEELIAIIARGRTRRLLDPRTEDEILGYDDQGLPG